MHERHLCKDCKNYHGDGLCRSDKNRKGYTSALDLGRECWEPKEGEEAPVEPAKVEVMKLGPESPVKRCTKCGRLMPVEAFNRHAKTRDGYAKMCKDCQSAVIRAAVKASPKKPGPRPSAEKAVDPAPAEGERVESVLNVEIKTEGVAETAQKAQEAAIKTKEAVETMSMAEALSKAGTTDLVAELQKRGWKGNLVHHVEIDL